MFGRRRRPTGLAPGERVLATGTAADGEVVATTRRLILPAASLAWNEIEIASWDGDGQTLAVTSVPDSSGRRARHRVIVESPGRMVDVVREQVTASVIISRRMVVDGGRGVRVTGRRTWQGDLVWSASLDPGVDLDDPATRARVDAAVALIRGEVE